MPWKSSFADASIPDVSLPSLVLARAGELGDKPALIDGPSGRTLTYGQLAEGVRRVAPRLGRPRLRRGRRARPLQPEPAGVRGRLPRRVAGLAGSSRRSTRCHRRRAGQPAQRLPGATFLVTVPPFLDKALQAARAVGRRGGVRLRRGRGRDAVRGAARRGRRRCPQVEIDPREDLVVAAVLERHDRPAQGRDAHAPQPGREPLSRCDGVDAIARGRRASIAVLPFFHIYGMVGAA